VLRCTKSTAVNIYKKPFPETRQLVLQSARKEEEEGKERFKKKRRREKKKLNSKPILPQQRHFKIQPNPESMFYLH
jgi:hypothetical protein